MIDPRADNYLALYISIIWYCEITPEQAFRIIKGRSKMKPERRQITPEIIARIDKIMCNKNFRSYKKLERTFKLNRYDMYELVRKNRIQVLCSVLKQIIDKK